MEFSLQQLRMLRALAAEGTMAAAAASLDYTPSAVSQQLGALEKSAGVVLFERLGRSVRLTNAGRELARSAVTILDSVEEATAAVERVRGEAVGETVLGVMESVTVTLLPAILREMSERYPRLELHTLEAFQDDPFDLVRSGRIDASFILGYPEAPGPVESGMERLLVCRDRFWAVEPEAWARERGVSAEEARPIDLAVLADRPWIVPPDGISLGQSVRRACRAAGFEPDVRHEIDDYPATLQLVAAEAGVALVPDLGLRFLPDEVRVTSLAAPAYRLIELVYRRTSSDRPAIRALIDVCGRVADAEGLDRGVGEGEGEG